ncbi:MAG: efflux RND transporter permease subunit [Xanthomonadales bacterium]|jgi:multidrug efflux pump subunit AcrB|nr:efflux RND transporter permease subunit [Xanthomonadales bacterium]MDH3941001.1 efflux RND transporter permease subunit [Xanthomonadales bacterium]MDH3999924.1 efflux RND transporter permease subunit [Xanthomonadales bacterium]
MKWLARSLDQRRMIISLVLLLSLTGLVAWLGMVRQEDPAFPYRYGYVMVQFPGADVEQVEHLVARPLEEEISEVEEVDEIKTTIRAGFLHAIIGMKQTVYDTDNVWDRLRVAVSRAQSRFPDGVLPAVIDDRQVDAATAVLAVSGSDDIEELQRAAERLKNRLYSLKAVSRVRLFGDSGEQVTVAIDDARIQTLGLTPEIIMGQLKSRNEIVPGGFVEVDGRQTLVRPQTEFRSIEEIANTPMVLSGGQSVPLSSIADVRLEVADPPVQTAWMNGTQVVAVAITVARNEVNVVRFGDQLRRFVDGIRPEFAPLTIEEMFFQPEHVEARLSELGYSLLLGVLIVGTVLLVLMGPRMGFVVALIVPLVTLSSLSVFAMGGGVLHQMAVAGLVIALGMLVDNAIVMVENIQWHMDRGASAVEAAVMSVIELARPLGAATGTTLAVFVPMAISRGDTADFTRGIPITILIMLSMSYLFAILVTPLISQVVLRPRAGSDHKQRMARAGEWIGRFSVRHGPRVIMVAIVLVIVAAIGGREVGQEFFPDTDRRQMVVDIYYPEGTPIDVTTGFATALASELAGFEESVDVFTFSGNSGPRFFYNLNENPRAPQIGRVVVNTRRIEDLPTLMNWVRQQASSRWPEVQIVARRLSQGPPAPAPVELRIVGQDRLALARFTETLTAMLRDIPGTVDVRHNLGIGIPSLRFEFNDSIADARGLSRTQLAQALARQTQGLFIGHFRAGEDPVPIVLRSREGSRFDLGQLLAVNAYADVNQAIPVMDTGQSSMEWQAAVIHHLNLEPVVTVYSELKEGATYPEIYEEVFSRLAETGLPPGLRVVPGGYAESSGEANSALFKTLPIGLILLLFFLLLQFNSYRRVLIILVTVPLAITGVVPGLLLSGYSFGFTAMLGVITLMGIVVNNAIVLIDTIDGHLDSGMDSSEAVARAVSRRTRPILLTTLTTVAGLLPLTFASSTLWPPMAWSIISGLLAATILTLGVVPTLSHWLLKTPPR